MSLRERTGIEPVTFGLQEPRRASRRATMTRDERQRKRHGLRFLAPFEVPGKPLPKRASDQRCGVDVASRSGPAREPANQHIRV
jgi:hypothetical protein